MCARLLACPLCSQPGFHTLDSLRAGLVSVATRPLACPVCNEILLGIDKLTIHLFGHTINQCNNNSNNGNNNIVSNGNESTKIIEVTSNNVGNVQAIMRSAQAIPVQSWNVLSAAPQNVETNNDNRQLEDNNQENASTGIYIPINEIEAFRSLTGLKDSGNVISVNNDQNSTANMKTTSQVIFLQNVTTNLVNPINNHEDPIPVDILQNIPITATTTTTTTNVQAASINETHRQDSNSNGVDVNETIADDDVVILSSVNDADKTTKKSFTETSWGQNTNTEPPPPPPPPPPSKFPPSHTDRLADLVKNAQITSSPLGSFHESFNCSKPTNTQPDQPTKLREKSTRILSATEKTERCNICGFHFPDRKILILHKQLVHAAQEKNSKGAQEDLMKNYPCRLCTKVFKMKGSLMVHMRVAHPIYTTAESLQKKYQSKESVKTVDLPQSELSDDGYNCPTCGKIFKKEQQVIQHIKIHEGKQWECEICTKMFTTKYFLKKHKRLHSGEMPYKCTICDKTFTFQQSYHKHRLYHKDDKPHTCITCGRSFKELSTLHNHERIHTGEKPFACETCGKCFRQRVSYLVHRRIHTGVMPYKCTACGKNFRYKVSQRTHKCPQQSTDADAHKSEFHGQNSLELPEVNETQTSLSKDNEKNIDSSVANEENQYVLVLNEDGQHVLRRKIDVDNESKQNVNENTTNQNKESVTESSEFFENIWNQQTPNQMEYRENNSKTDDTVSDVIKETNFWNETCNNKDSSNNISKDFNAKETDDFVNSLWNETSANDIAPSKNQSTNIRDFFSMVMSPLESEIHSPSSEMEHLRLSSPVNNQEN